MGSEDNEPRNSGRIKVTWADCPNKECPSRGWKEWDVVYAGGDFKCGTCEQRLRKPIFSAGD